MTQDVVKPSRDSWCTPQWLTKILGVFDLDPCGNRSSSVRCNHTLELELDDDGLANPDIPGSYIMGGQELCIADETTRTFINPPYYKNQVIRWVRHWKHTDFCFLLRWDPSTVWFKEVMERTSLVWFPHRRLNFEPPSGIEASSNPFPHALYYAHDPNIRIGNQLANLGRFFRPLQ